MAFMVGGSVMRDASGDVNDIWNVFNSSLATVSTFNDTRNDSMESVTMAAEYSSPIVWSAYGTKFNCTGNCSYGSQNSFQVVVSLCRSNIN